MFRLSFGMFFPRETWRKTTCSTWKSWCKCNLFLSKIQVPSKVLVQLGMRFKHQRVLNGTLAPSLECAYISMVTCLVVYITYLGEKNIYIYMRITKKCILYTVITTKKIVHDLTSRLCQLYSWAPNPYGTGYWPQGLWKKVRLAMASHSNSLLVCPRSVVNMSHTKLRHVQM